LFVSWIGCYILSDIESKKEEEEEEEEEEEREKERKKGNGKQNCVDHSLSVSSRCYSC
jgi:hypothetical protein